MADWVTIRFNDTGDEIDVDITHIDFIGDAVSHRVAFGITASAVQDDLIALFERRRDGGEDGQDE